MISIDILTFKRYILRVETAFRAVSAKIAVLLLSIYTFQSLHAVETTIVGEIVDSETAQPVANVNLALIGTPFGTTTNAEGIFLLRADLKHRTTLTVSAIGYKTQRFKIEPGISAGIDITLEEKTTYLQDVFVVPGANPALPLMARIRERRKINQQSCIFAPSNEATDVFVSDIQARHLRRRFWQHLQNGLIQAEDSTYFLPLYHSATKGGQTTSRAVLLPEEEYRAQLAYLDTPPDFYANTIPFYGTNFLSPLAADGNAFYHFYLIDSLYIDADSTSAHGRKAYIIDFRTKNPYYPTFNGRMTIDSLTCALLSIEANAPHEVAANYLRALTICQQFAFNPDSHPTADQQPTDGRIYRTYTAETMILDYAVRFDTTRTLPTVLIRHTAAADRFPKDEGLPFLSARDSCMTATDADSAMQNVANLPLIRVADFLANTILTGYIPAGRWLEVGNINQFFRVTPRDGVRVGVGLRTSPQLMRNICLDAYVGYGFRDQSFKGGAGLHFNLPTPRRHQLHLTFADDYQYLDRAAFGSLYLENAALFNQRDFTTALTQAFIPPSRLTASNQIRTRELRFASTNDWSSHLEQDFYATLSRYESREPRTQNPEPITRIASVGTTLRLSFDEKKIDLFFRRIHVYGKLPILCLGLETGTVQYDGTPSYQLYGRINLMIRQQVPLGVMGSLDYLIEAGLLFGETPAPLRKYFSGNESVSYAFDRFTLMNNLQAGANRYVLLHTHWNGRGCLFNLIPGIRVLRLRELATFKLAWGEPFNVPYTEIGVGIGNILRVCNIYSLWRLTHRNEPASPNWAIRFQFSLEK